MPAVAKRPFFHPRHPDWYLGGQAGERILADERDNIVFGRGGDDTIQGGRGHDRLLGGAGHDSLDGGEGHDTIFAGDGRDTLLGGDGNDMMSGGAGDDLLCGGSGDDRLFGAEGADRLSGEAGADVLNGGQGDDTLDGGAGDDIIIGGPGRDLLTGGGGADVFSYYHAGTSLAGAGRRDVITDFNRAEGDRIQLLFGGFGDAANPGGIAVVAFGTGSLLRVDRDGDGSADFEVEITNAVVTMADLIFA